MTHNHERAYVSLTPLYFAKVGLLFTQQLFRGRSTGVQAVQAYTSPHTEHPVLVLMRAPTHLAPLHIDTAQAVWSFVFPLFLFI